MAVSQPPQAAVGRIRLDRDGITLRNGAGIHSYSLALVGCGAVYAAFTDSRWWVPLAVLLLIPAAMIASWKNVIRSEEEGKAAQRARMLNVARVAAAPSPGVALTQDVIAYLRQSGFAISQGSVTNGCIIHLPNEDFHLEIVGPPGGD